MSDQGDEAYNGDLIGNDKLYTHERIVCAMGRKGLCYSLGEESWEERVRLRVLIDLLKERKC